MRSKFIDFLKSFLCLKRKTDDNVVEVVAVVVVAAVVVLLMRECLLNGKT